ncbi:ATP-binding protein [Flammeovirgaceae bacterium SG7u.111]|nr:ATP-binding protein [Flammeovirgaceae bacterium SG7u.132]WPO35511.1 ATP-binding protein [Flammeovirgaceae bacterium SG7u.111]
MTKNNSLKLKIPSLIDNIRIVESFIDHARETFHFNDDIYGNIMVAVTESVNNAIVHGNQNNKNKNVHISLEVNEANINFIIKDEGKGFDPKKLADPTAAENINSPGGRGIFLIKHLADEVKFLSEGKEIKMTFYMNT